MTDLVTIGMRHGGVTATPSRHASRLGRGRDEREASMMVPVVTLVLWTGCLAVGVAGNLLPEPGPLPARVEPPPLAATILKVQLTDAPRARVSEVRARGEVETSPLPPLARMPEVPPAPVLVAVAQPSPKIAFELPVEGPVRVVEAEVVASVGSAAPGPEVADVPAGAPDGTGTPGRAPGGTGTALQSLTYGQGEGRQPAPDYPRQAVRERQQGTVLVRFTVGEHGRVLTAEAVAPCPWPLLNAAAVRAVRERWQFRPGPVRLYEVPIRFELTRS